MTYVLRVRSPEAEPYTHLETREEVEQAVAEEVEKTVEELGSDILDEGTDIEKFRVCEELTAAAMADLFVRPRRGERFTEHVLPGSLADHRTGRRLPGVRLTLEEVSDERA